MRVPTLVDSEYVSLEEAKMFFEDFLIGMMPSEADRFLTDIESEYWLHVGAVVTRDFDTRRVVVFLNDPNKRQIRKVDIG